MAQRKTLAIHKAWVVAALFASAVLPVARAADSEILTKVPGDVYGLVVINNVRTFSNKVSNAATRLALPLPPDLVGYATRSLGIQKGFDSNSSAAVLFLKPSAEHQADGYFNGPPPAVLLLPTTDAKGMLEAFQPGEPDKGGISTVVLPQDPNEKGFVSIVDNRWIAFAQSHEDLAAYLAKTDSFAAKVSAATKKIFDTNDMVIWGNVPKLSAGVDKALDNAQQDVSGMMELANLAGNQDPLAGAMQKQFITLGFGFVKEFLKDADASMITVRLTDSGATFGIVGDFRSESPIGKFVASQKGAKPVNLQGLPAASNFLAAGAMSWDPASVSGIIGKVGEQVLADEAIAKDARATDIKKFFDLIKQSMSLSNGMSMVVLDPPASGQNGYVSAVTLVDTTDPVQFKKIQLEMLNSALMQESMNPDIKQKVTSSIDAVTIKDVKFTKFNVKFSLREETPDRPLNPMSKMSLQIIEKMYGPDGLTWYSGIAGKRALMVYGTDGPTLEGAVTAALSNADNLSGNPVIAGMKDQIVANPVAVAYLPITRWVTLAQSIMKPSADGDTPAGPAILNAPPIVISAGVTGSMMTEEIHVPIAAILGTKEAVQRLQRAMMGGFGPGPALP